MKLSEAIRLGSMVHPQGFGKSRQVDYRGITHTCALGAVTTAIGNPAYEAMHVLLPALNWMSTCPACNLFSRSPGVGAGMPILIAHLNDSHHWTREAIADWVEQLEAQHDVEANSGGVLSTTGNTDDIDSKVGDPACAGVDRT